MESALDDLINIAEESAKKYGLDSLVKNCQASRAELVALRQRIAELEAQAANQPIGVCQNCGHSSSDHNHDGIHPCGQCDCLAYATTIPATLTPRQCNRACFDRGWQAAIEAAAGAVRSLSHMPSAYEDAIRAIAMQPPAECGCNPLKPSESDAAMLDEWHKRM